MPHDHPTASPLAVRSTSPCRMEAAASTGAAPPVSTGTSQPSYSIRLAEEGGTPCALCLEATGTGPVGYLDKKPVCDMCLLLNCQGLGMVLALVAVTREYGAFEPESEAEWKGAMAQLGAFARVFERFSVRFGPRRRILKPDDLEGSSVH